VSVLNIIKHKGSRIVSVRPEATVAQAVAVLHEKRIGAVLVRDVRGALVGILSERDVVRGIVRYGAAVLEKPIRALMTANVVSCTPRDDVRHVMEVMTMRRVRHLPVTEAGTLKGIISIGDVVKHRLDMAQLEVNVLRDYARSH